MWKNLSVGQQADIIGMAAKQGITDIRQIEDLYNYSSGAITPEELGKSGQHNKLQQQQDGIKAFEMAEKEYLIRQRMERNGMGQTKPYNGYFTQSSLPENNNSLFGDKGTKFAYGGNTVSGSNRWYSFVEKYLPLIEAELTKYNDAHQYLAKNLLWQMAQESEYGTKIPNKTNFWGIRNPGKKTYRDFGTFEKGLAYWIQQIHDNYPDAWKAVNVADYAMGLTTGNNGFRYMEASPLQYMQNMKTLERYYNQYMLDNNRNIETENESYTPIQQTIVTPQPVFESGVQQNPVNNQTQGQQGNVNTNKSNASFQEWLDNLYDDGFAYGGPTKPNFILRLENPNRKYIRDWVNPDDIATHKLGWFTEGDQAVVYPEVQEINGKLIDFTRPPYSRNAGMQSAIERGDTLRMTPRQAQFYTQMYKGLYPKGNTFAEGGLMGPDDPEELARQLRAAVDASYRTPTTISSDNTMVNTPSAQEIQARNQITQTNTIKQQIADKDAQTRGYNSAAEEKAVLDYNEATQGTISPATEKPQGQYYVDKNPITGSYMGDALTAGLVLQGIFNPVGTAGMVIGGGLAGEGINYGIRKASNNQLTGWGNAVGTLLQTDPKYNTAWDWTNPGYFIGGKYGLKIGNYLKDWRLTVPKDINRYYRIVGEAGDPIGDANRTGVIRGPGLNEGAFEAMRQANNDMGKIILTKAHDYPMFSKGEPWRGSTAQTKTDLKKRPIIIRSKENTGPIVWEESNKDFKHKGHNGIFRPSYYGDVNASPTRFFEYLKPQIIGYKRFDFSPNNNPLSNFLVEYLQNMQK